MRYDAVILFFLSCLFCLVWGVVLSLFYLAYSLLYKGLADEERQKWIVLYNAKEVQNPLSAPNLTLILRLKTFFIVEIM